MVFPFSKLVWIYISTDAQIIIKRKSARLSIFLENKIDFLENKIDIKI